MTIENISRSITMKVWGRARIKLTTSGSAIKLSTDCATVVRNKLVLLKTNACLIHYFFKLQIKMN